jgi:hypothetical protein
MSEQITHLGVLDDCRRLALEVDGTVLCDEVKRVLADRRGAARRGSLSRGNDENLIPGVLKAREQWDDRVGERQFERDFAYVLGWYVHRATDRYFKPAFREVDPDYGDSDNRRLYRRADGGGPRNLVKIYHDTVLYDRIYAGDGSDPFREGNFEVTMGSHPGADAVDVTRTEELFQYKWMAELVATYESVCSGEGPPGEGTVDEVLGQRQTAGYMTRWFQEAHDEPDIGHLDRFINEPNFYDGDDPIVATARAIQRGESPDVDVEALIENPGDSQYAECLAQAYRYLRAASDLFTGENEPMESAEIVAVARLYRDQAPTPHPTARADPTALEDLPLAEVAAVEDGLRLAFIDDRLSERTRDVVAEDPGAAHAAAFADPGEWLAETLEDVRSPRADRRSHGPERIAFASGVLGYDRVAGRFGSDRTRSDDRFARDVRVLRERSRRANPDSADADVVTDLIEGFEPRIRQRWHTLRADKRKDHFPAWSRRFFGWVDAQPERRREIAEAYAEGESAGPRFYDPEDSLIRLARSTRDARTRGLPGLGEALATADEQSRYARALADVVDAVRAVDAYAERDVDTDEFLARIE